MGEGAGILILEELETARRRGAKIYCEIVGYGMSGDAYHISAPCETGDGAIRVMKKTLKDAERRALGRRLRERARHLHAAGRQGRGASPSRRVFGEHARKLAISSTKSMTGHLLGAAGGLEAGITALTLRDQVIAPTINYENPDPECDLDFVPNTARKADVRYVLSNSFGFGGTNGALLFKRWEESRSSMKIVVCVKQVPGHRGPDPDRRRRQGHRRERPQLDRVALRRVRDRGGAEASRRPRAARWSSSPWAPTASQSALRNGLAMGADSAIHLKDPLFDGLDSLGTALGAGGGDQAAGARPRSSTGQQGVGTDNSQVPGMLAEILDLPQVTMAVKIEIDGRQGDGASARSRARTRPGRRRCPR